MSRIAQSRRPTIESHDQDLEAPLQVVIRKPVVMTTGFTGNEATTGPLSVVSSPLSVVRGPWSVVASEAEAGTTEAICRRTNPPLVRCPWSVVRCPFVVAAVEGGRDRARTNRSHRWFGTMQRTEATEGVAVALRSRQKRWDIRGPGSYDANSMAGDAGHAGLGEDDPDPYAEIEKDEARKTRLEMRSRGGR